MTPRYSEHAAIRVSCKRLRVARDIFASRPNGLPCAPTYTALPVFPPDTGRSVRQTCGREFWVYRKRKSPTLVICSSACCWTPALFLHTSLRSPALFSRSLSLSHTHSCLLATFQSQINILLPEKKKAVKTYLLYADSFMSRRKERKG